MPPPLCVYIEITSKKSHLLFKLVDFIDLIIEMLLNFLFLTRLAFAAIKIIKFSQSHDFNYGVGRLI